MRRRSGLYLSVIIDNISSSSSGVVEHSKYFSNIYYFSLSLPLQVQPRVLLRYHHWRQARWTCRHDIAGRCRAQDGRELSCSLHWSVNPTILGEFRMLLLLLVLSSRSNHIIIQSSSHTLSTYVCLFLLLFLSSCSQARRDLDLPDHPSTVSSPVSCARGKRRYRTSIVCGSSRMYY